MTNTNPRMVKGKINGRGHHLICSVQVKERLSVFFLTEINIYHLHFIIVIIPNKPSCTINFHKLIKKCACNHMHHQRHEKASSTNHLSRSCMPRSSKLTIFETKNSKHWTTLYTNLVLFQLQIFGTETGINNQENRIALNNQRFNYT